MYSDLKPMVVGDDLSLVATAGDALYTMVLPTGHREIVVRAITQRVHTATAASDSAANDYPCVYLANGSTTVKTCTGIAAKSVAGTATYDEIADGTAGQRFKAGDTLYVKISEVAKTTGKYQVILWID